MDLAGASSRGADVATMLQAYQKSSMPECSAQPFLPESQLASSFSCLTGAQELDYSKGRKDAQARQGEARSHRVAFAQDIHSLRGAKLILAAILALFYFMVAL